MKGMHSPNIIFLWLGVLGWPLMSESVIQDICVYSVCMYVCNAYMIKNILNSCPTRGRAEGWVAMKPLFWRSVNSKDASRPCLTHHYRGGWNQMNERSVENWWNEICGRENGRNPKKNLPRLRSVLHETKVGVIERRARDPRGGRRASSPVMLKVFSLGTWRSHCTFPYNQPFVVGE